MKNIFVFSTCLFLSFAFAQTSFSAQENSAAVRPGAGDRREEPQKPERFEDVKARHLTAISRRIETLQQTKNCVQAANDFKAMQACRPEYPRQPPKPGL